MITFDEFYKGAATDEERIVRWSYFVGQSEGDLKVDSDGVQSPRGSA